MFVAVDPMMKITKMSCSLSLSVCVCMEKYGVADQKDLNEDDVDVERQSENAQHAFRQLNEILINPL